jgi:hypothetical protein
LEATCSLLDWTGVRSLTVEQARAGIGSGKAPRGSSEE